MVIYSNNCSSKCTRYTYEFLQCQDCICGTGFCCALSQCAESGSEHSCASAPVYCLFFVPFFFGLSRGLGLYHLSDCLPSMEMLIPPSPWKGALLPLARKGPKESSATSHLMRVNMNPSRQLRMISNPVRGQRDRKRSPFSDKVPYLIKSFALILLQKSYTCITALTTNCVTKYTNYILHYYCLSWRSSIFFIAKNVGFSY